VQKQNYQRDRPTIPKNAIAQSLTLQLILIKSTTRRVTGRNLAVGFRFLFVAGLKTNCCKNTIAQSLTKNTIAQSLTKNMIAQSPTKKHDRPIIDQKHDRPIIPLPKT